MSRTNHIYTPEDDARIIAIRKRGKTYGDIATAMGQGFTENGIRHRARHLRAVGLMPTRKITIPAKKPEEPKKAVERPKYWAATLWTQAMRRGSSAA